MNNKEIFDNYCNSHWSKPEDTSNEPGGLLGPKLWGLTPRQHTLETFTEECEKNPEFKKKYTDTIYDKPW